MSFTILIHKSASSTILQLFEPLTLSNLFKPLLSSL